jgi:hypothetical protein
MAVAPYMANNHAINTPLFIDYFTRGSKAAAPRARTYLETGTAIYRATL